MMWPWVILTLVFIVQPRPISTTSMTTTATRRMRMLIIMNSNNGRGGGGGGGGGFGGGSKGFGSAKSILQSVLQATRPGEYRRVEGQYSKLLSKVSEVFEALKPLHGCTKDVYVRLSSSQVCFFVGKIAHTPRFQPNDAVLFYAPLILEYSKSLRPRELSGPGRMRAGPKAILEIWMAPGNSEMDVAKNMITLEKLELPEYDETTSLSEISSEIGYEPEVYMGGEEGFRVLRDDRGVPLKAPFEVEFRDPSELERMKKQ